VSKPITKGAISKDIYAISENLELECKKKTTIPASSRELSGQNQSNFESPTKMDSFYGQKRPENFNSRKIRSLYGKRVSIKLWQNSKKILRKKKSQMRKQSLNDQRDKMQQPEKLPFSQRIIISPDNKPKSMFDVMILLLVGYSCCWNIFYFAFPIVPGDLLKVLNNVVEYLFVLDFILNFFQGFRHPETYENITDMKQIGLRYLMGWFFIDLASIFPF